MIQALQADQGLGFLESCLVEGDSQSAKGARRGKQRALALSIVLQILGVALLVVVPLLGRGERMSLKNMTALPPIARFASPPSNPERTPRRNRLACTFCAPSHIPPAIVTRDPTTARRDSDDNFDDLEISRYGEPHGDPNGFLNSDSTRGPKPPDERVNSNTQTPVRRRISEPVQAAQLTQRIEPVYPPLARQLRREGRVELSAIIPADGTIESLEVISGDPLLVHSALDAVWRWRYRPTILNGQSVEVETHITVIYTLAH
jgi:protein TonB